MQEDQDLTQARDQDLIYGSQLMTQEERMQHRAQMLSAATEVEREQIRYEHHEHMVARAQGVSVFLMKCLQEATKWELVKVWDLVEWGLGKVR